MRITDTKEPFSTLLYNDDVLIACRNHIECLQNLSYLFRLNTRQVAPTQLNMDLVEFHLKRLTELLFPSQNFVGPITPCPIPHNSHSNTPTRFRASPHPRAQRHQGQVKRPEASDTAPASTPAKLLSTPNPA